VVIKLNGHTDARGDIYNNLLTSKRAAEKAVKYLMKKGIDEANLIPRGYGERYLLNQCRRGKWCDEETHLKNMRIEVVVWRMLD
jgi:outer membrane protein OmpA-like peptidoglycan-associated protein